MASVFTIRDFTQIFDAYAEFSETLISALMDELQSPDAVSFCSNFSKY